MSKADEFGKRLAHLNTQPGMFNYQALAADAITALRTAEDELARVRAALVRAKDVLRHDQRDVGAALVLIDAAITKSKETPND